MSDAELPLTEPNLKAQDDMNALKSPAISLTTSYIPQRLGKQQRERFWAFFMPQSSCCYCAGTDLTGTCAEAAAFAFCLLNEAVLVCCI